MKRLLVLLLLLYPLSASAQTYEWTDARGTVNFTEDLGKVPKKYRKKVKVIGADEGTTQIIDTTEPVKGKTKDLGTQTEKKPLESGKDEAGLRNEIAATKNQLQATEKELEGLRGRLGDTSKMSRSEYLTIQNSIKHYEVRVQELNKKLDKLREKVPGGPTDSRQ